MFKLFGVYWHTPSWLLLIPLIAIPLYFLWQQTIALSFWNKYLPSPFQKLLLSAEQKRRKSPLIVLGIIWFAMLLALAGPNFNPPAPSSTSDRPLVIVLKVSPSMLATDLAPTRLSQAKTAVLEYAQQSLPYSTAVVVYAGSPHTLVPLTQDNHTLKNLLLAIEPEIMPVAGNRADLALKHALSLVPNREQNPILLLADTLTSEEQQGIQQLLHRQKINLHLMMIGTENGVPLMDKSGQLVRDAQGNISLAQLDQKQLKGFAEALDKPVYFLDHSPASLQAIQAPLTAHWREQDLYRQGNQGYWLLLPILALAAFMARRGWLFVLFICFTPLPAPAATWQALWLNQEQQAYQLLTQDPAQAAQLFKQRQWQAVAYYQAQNYEQAANLFALGDSAEDKYNLGNCYAELGDFNNAILAYEQALVRNPALTVALTNKQRIEQYIAAQEKQEQQPRPTPESQPAPMAGLTTTDPTQQSTSLSDNQTDSAQNNPSLTKEQSLNHWLKQINDDPSELLRRKFWLEQQRQAQP